jgi:hypothetical protein
MKSQKSDTEFAGSTAPLDETPPWVTAVPGGENNPVTRVPSHSLHEVTKHDYAYQAHKEAMTRNKIAALHINSKF